MTTAVVHLTWKPQEVPFTHADSHHLFAKRFYTTAAALREFGEPVIIDCYRRLRIAAAQFDGIDYLQVFLDPESPDRRLWFIEDDGPEGVVTALLPDDY